MFLQDRPFFRKLKKIKLNSTNTIYKSRLSYKSASRQKLTQHKTKKGFMLKRDNIWSNLHCAHNKKWLLKKISLNTLGLPVSSTIECYLGLLKIIPYVSGSSFSSYYRWILVNNLSVLTSFSLPFITKTRLLFSCVELPTKKLCMTTSKPGYLSLDGSVQIKINKVEKFWPSKAVLGSIIKGQVHSHGITSKVRGVAKNPVDHPNGGRAKTKGSFKTPWGSIAKAGK